MHPALSSADLLTDRRGAIARLSRIPNPASAIPQSQTRSRASQTMTDWSPQLPEAAERAA
ncbi:hypothetical protein [Thermoleptolyngbya sp. M55_K2018_002]|uniref:hypothetical protein n=1 Tax=Thermoleptolyngbya sp. M55_K2018_002 TaxID=2747808 RepID=UPI0025E1C611|nr:hypothetical protein [Thermoleptolyngbya sp. M55_K2018_002]